MPSKLSEHFQKARSAKELRLGQLARLCGYTNVSKGCRKIQEFERGGNIQEDLLLKMADALGIDRMTVERLIDEDRRRFFEEWSAWANTPVRPHLVVRWMAAIYGTLQLPDEVQSVEAAEAYASAFARDHGTKLCLVLSRRISVWFGEDGSVRSVTESVPGQPNSPHMQIGGKHCVFKSLDHGIAIQQVNWLAKQEVITDKPVQRHD